jgi:glycosyltransferase involved in cell wall biosynthesis
MSDAVTHEPPGDSITSSPTQGIGAQTKRDDTPLSIMHVLAPGEVGGLESVVRSLASAQQRAGHRVLVACVLESASPHPYVASLVEAGLDARVVIAPGRAFSRERAQIAALCAESRADVMHTHGYRPDLVDAPVARRLGIATVSTIHGFTGGGIKMRAYEWLVQRAYRRFDALIAVSSPIRDRVIASGVPGARVHVIRNAFVAPPASFLDRAAARRSLGIPESAFAIGWVGRLSHEKGVDVFVRALAHMKRAENVHASIIGAGPSEVDMRALAAATGVSDKLHWLGTIPDSYRLYRAFDAFVLSSRTEGTPMVLLEAMAAEVPVVTTAVGGVPDVVRSTEALLVPPEQPAVLADAIEAVRQEPIVARARAVAARRRLDEVFAVGPWLEQHETLYRSVRRHATADGAA